jgi:hypothetical protein
VVELEKEIWFKKRFKNGIGLDFAIKSFLKARAYL